jgi:hypothetical protein
MPNEMLIHSNDTENGYIYKELNNRITTLENTIEQMYNLLSQVAGDTGTVEQLMNMMDEINKRAKTTYVDNHIEDSTRHLNDVKVMEWDSKYDKPYNGIPESDLEVNVRRKINGGASGGTGVGLQYTLNIGDNVKTSFTINHRLTTKDVTVDIIEILTGECVMADWKVIDEDNAQISFTIPPALGQYRIIING